MAKKRVKKHIFDLSTQEFSSHLQIIGIRTYMPLHKLVYFLNKSFDLHLYLYPTPIKINRNKKNLEFYFYTIQADEYEDHVFLVNNETLYEVEDLGSLFSSQEAYYLIREVENINYLLYIPINHYLKLTYLQQQFKSPYSVKWVEINIDKIANSVPNFPIY